jgi:phosphate-selective porin OprO/OprP
MSKVILTTVAAIGVIGALMTSQARAESASGTDAEIALLKKQLQLLEQKLDKLQKQTAANTTAAANANAKAKADVQATVANAAYPVKGPVASADAVVHMTNNRPTICTADEQNCIAITGRVHFDGGGYDYHPSTAATVPQRLDNGVNARRARIGVAGKFLNDWNFALIYDFGGTSDGFGGTGSVGGTAVGFLPGGALSGLENAYLSYTGLKPFGGQLAIEGGVMDVPYTLDEATSSNDILFMERASSNVIATSIAAGDFRSTAGARWFDDRFWVGAYATGPATGAIHSASSINPPGTTEQFGAVARVGGPTRQYQGILAAPRRQCRMADQTAAQSDRQHPDAHAQRSARTAHRSDLADLHGSDRRRIRRPSLQRRGSRNDRVVVRARRILLVQCRSRLHRPAQPEFPGRLCASGLHPDRRNPRL